MMIDMTRDYATTPEQRKQMRSYYRANKAERDAYCRQYREEHREQLRKYNRAYYLRNNEKLTAYARDYYAAHKDEIIARRRAKKKANT